MGGNERIVLLVDDEDSICLALEMVLADAGFTAITVSNAADAIKALGNHEFGVAILDKNLPDGESGLKLLKLIRAEYPRIKVLLHTGFPTTDSAIAALQSGAFDYVPKPAETQLIVEKVKRAWSSYTLECERDELFRNYETLFEVVPGVVWFLTDEGRFRRISNQGAALLGYRPSELIGKSYKEFITPGTDDPAVYWAFNERRRGERATQRKVVRMVTRSGAERTFEVSSASATDPVETIGEEQRQGTIVVGVDVTDRVGLLSHLQEHSKMDALGRMAGGVAHDFNNALSVIISLGGILRDDSGLSDESQELLSDIQEAANRAADLSRQLLLFSRRHHDSKPELVSPGPVLQEVDRMLRRLLRENISLDVKIDDDLGQVRVNSTQLHQVIMNLGVNASDAMPEGGAISISAKNVEVDQDFATQYPGVGAGKFIQLAVSDTGTGIAPELRSRVFEPFFTTKEIGQGTGLGLAIVYSVVKLCGGHVTVYSEGGLGTTFKVYLPRAVEEEVEPPVPFKAMAGGQESLLLVEDNAIVRRSAKRLLVRHGYSVTEASDGEEGLQIWQSQGPFALVITDIVMPKMGGLELALKLRELAPHVPILYVSGYHGDLSSRFQLVRHRSLVLEKPFTRDSLPQSVRRLLDTGADAVGGQAD